MPSFRDLITQANAATREQFVYWCLLGWETLPNSEHLREYGFASAADALEKSALDENPAPYAHSDCYWLILSRLADVHEALVSYFNDPTLDDDRQIRFIMSFTVNRLNMPREQRYRDAALTACLEKLQSLIKAQEKSLSLSEYQHLHYEPSLKFREFDQLFQRASPQTREHFITWCIDEWARAAVVEILSQANLLDQARRLETETDWPQVQRLAHQLRQLTKHAEWEAAWASDSETRWYKMQEGWTKDDILQEYYQAWDRFHALRCADIRLTALADALYWYHNVLIDDERFRIRNMAFYAAQAALTPIPTIGQPVLKEMDVFIEAMTTKLRMLVNSQ